MRVIDKWQIITLQIFKGARALIFRAVGMALLTVPLSTLARQHPALQPMVSELDPAQVAGKVDAPRAGRPPASKQSSEMRLLRRSTN